MAAEDKESVSVDPNASDAEWNQALRAAILARINRRILRTVRVAGGWEIYIAPLVQAAPAPANPTGSPT